jgi:hypothetical protein
MFFEPTFHDFPIHYIPQGMEMIGSAVLIVEIIGVFPNVET